MGAAKKPKRLTKQDKLSEGVHTYNAYDFYKEVVKPIINL